MFSNFFFTLKKYGVPVSINEWMTLHSALDKGLANSSLNTFYEISRAILVKNEIFFDKFDLAFQEYFRGIETPEEMVQKILEGLEKAPFLNLTEEEKKLIEKLSLSEVLAKFKEQYRDEHFRAHIGGNKAIGTGGTSPFGAFGYNPAGIRIGQGGGGNKSAIKIAEQRKFRNYSSDLVLDTRQIRVALSKLRTLIPVGEEDELDVEKTIDKTCRNAGELELHWKRSKKNTVKLLVFMDTGGSMDPHARLCNLLFSAAKSQFRDLKYYYFHNCIYQEIWKDIERNEKLKTSEVIANLDNDYKVIIVGDASMSPSELLQINGCIDYFYSNDLPGVVWLSKILEKFDRCVWLNPERRKNWQYITTIGIIDGMFPMFELTLDGLEEAIKELLVSKKKKFFMRDFENSLEERFKKFIRI